MVTQRGKDIDQESLPELPDLEIPLPPCPSSLAARAEDSQVDRDLDLELERGGTVEPMQQRQGAFQVAPLDDFDALDPDAAEDTGAGALEIEVGSGATRGAWDWHAEEANSEGRAIDRPAFHVSESNVASLAGLGASPAGVLGTLRYAARFALRRPALRRASMQRERELVRAELERDRILAEFAHRRRALIHADGRFAPDLRKADALARQLGALGDAMQRLDHDNEVQSRHREQRIAEARRRLEDAESNTEALQAAARDAEVDLARREARSKRLQIELRNAQLANTETTDTEDRIREISTRLSAFERALLDARALAAEAKQRWKDGAGSVDEAAANLAREEKALRKVARAFTKEHGKRCAALTAEEQAFNRCMAEILLRALRSMGDVGLDEDELGALREADELVASRTVAAEEHRRALHSYDRNAVRRGFLLLALVLAALLCVLVWWTCSRAPAEDEGYSPGPQLEPGGSK